MGEVTHPLTTVQRLYQEAGPLGVEDGDWGVSQHFKSVLNQQTQVPQLRPDTIDLVLDRGLVRFRGMVQDMLDPEYYVGAFRQPDGTWVTTKFSDSAEGVNLSDPATYKIWERRALYCTAVPGESAWVTQSAVQQAPAAPSLAGSGSVSKRAREEDTDAADSIPLAACSLDNDAPIRQRATTKAPDKVARTEANDEADTVMDAQLQPSPLPPPNDGDCMVYVYSEGGEGPKLNEVVEVVGVLSRVPELGSLAAGAQGGDEELLAEELATRPPTSLVPRVHAILVEREADTQAVSNPAMAAMEVQHLRQAAIAWLAQAVGGDTLAAEYLLLQLVSRVHVRTEEQVLGLLSLNITACPEAGAPPSPANGAPAPQAAPAELSILGGAVRAALAALVPRCTALPLAIQNLNAGLWSPRRDYSSNRVVGGPLQLAAGTHLILDETVLTPGQLREIGITNLQALAKLLQSKVVDYDFKYFQLPQPVDSPVTILSAAPSLLKAAVDVCLPLRASQPIVAAEAIAAGAERAELAAVRRYLAHVRRLDFRIDDAQAQEVEGRLVGCMQKDRSTTLEGYFTWLTLARLMAVSHGEGGLSEARWRGMRALEHRRAERLRLDSITITSVKTAA